MIIIKEINPITENNGPGIRVEVVLSKDAGITLTPNELVDSIRKFRPYIELNGGGVTFNGDICNIEELSRACMICHKAGINTCIELDNYIEQYDSILKYIDIIIINKIEYIDEIIKKFNNIKIYTRNNEFNDDILNKYNIKIIEKIERF